MSSSLPIPLIPTFDSLSEPEQRRAIVKDALVQLAAHRYMPTSGIYLSLFYDKGCIVSEKWNSVRQILEEYQFETAICKVCALGAIMASQFRVNGDCPAGEMNIDTRTYNLSIIPYTLGSNDTISPFMQRYFSDEQLQLIEIAFELGYGGFRCYGGVRNWQEGDRGKTYEDNMKDFGIVIPVESAAKAISFGRAYEQPSDRLVAILTTIVNDPEAEFHP